MSYYFEYSNTHYVIVVYSGSIWLIWTINLKDSYHSHFLSTKYQNNNSQCWKFENANENSFGKQLFPRPESIRIEKSYKQ